MPGTATHIDDPATPCRNCGDPTPGAWCPSCGQRKAHLRASLTTLVHDLMEDQFGLEQRTPRTLFALFFRPGYLTREYLDGRVVRYVQPFKLYLISSLLLFLLVGFVSTRGLDGIGWGSDAMTSAVNGLEGEALADSIRAEVQRAVGGVGAPGVAAEGTPPAPAADTPPTGTSAQTDTVASSGDPWYEQVNVNTGNARLDGLIRARITRLGRMEPRDAIREVVRTFLAHTPTLLFLLLPVFAGVLKLLYLRSPTFYAEHFVFVLHNHAFLFGIFAVGILASLMGAGGLAPILFLWAAIYLYLAMRRVYGQGRRITALKYWTLGWCYFWILVVTFPVMVVVSLLLAG